MEAIKLEAEQIQNTLSTDVERAVDKLLKFTQDYSPDIQLTKRALKLNWDLARDKNKNREGVTGSYDVIQSETNVILQEVLSRLDANQIEIQKRVDTRQAIRQKFLDDAAEDKVVFSGKEISYQYNADGFHLVPFDLTLRLGEITAIVGANSSGKSTLIKVVAGEHLVKSGEVHYPLFDKRDVHDWIAIKERIAYIPQRLNEWDGYIRDYLYFTAACKGLRGKENLNEVKYIVHRLGLSDFINKKWKELSGGIQMRFELARALVWRPKLIILDEPLANLDIIAQEIFLRDLYHLAHSYKNPISILITSQHLHEIENISDRTVFLRDGEVVYNDLTANIGSERTCNTYEIATNTKLNDLRLALAKHGITRIINQGSSYTVMTERDIDSSAMLRILSSPESEIQISLFRDISNSTKILFE